jgi:hypothetical protein
MAGSRTLKLSILADVDDLKKNLKTGEKEVEGFGGKLEKFSKVAAAAFAAAAAAAAAYAGKLAIEGVKAAIEDEAAQKRLALALQNVTEATDDQITAVEKQILKTSLATGVADDKLRPALQRLAVATGSVEKSQELLNIALDVSAATGKDVETVSNALGKAYEGNTSSLSRLGIGLSAAEIKTLGLEGSIKQLSDTFGGAAATQAETFEGRIARLQVAFDETKETVGTFLLPIIDKLLKFITDTAIPKFQELKSTAVDPIVKAFKNNEDALRDLWAFAKDYLIPLFNGALINAVKGVATAVSGIINVVGTVVTSIKNLVNDAINAINRVIRAYNSIPTLPNIATIPNIGTGSAGTGSNTVAPGGLPFGGTASGSGSGSGSGTSGGGSSGSIPPISVPPVAGGTGTGSGTATSGSATSGAPVFSIPGITNPTQFVRDFLGFTQTGTGALGGRGDLRPDDGGGVTIIVQAPSVIDEEGFSRAVVDALNQATNRGTGGGGGLRDTAQVL